MYTTFMKKIEVYKGYGKGFFADSLILKNEEDIKRL